MDRFERLKTWIARPQEPLPPPDTRVALGVLLEWNGTAFWLNFNITFILEAIAIIAFARSWLLKGRALMYQHLKDEQEVEAQHICYSQ